MRLWIASSLTLLAMTVALLENRTMKKADAARAPP
jgi:hypothetical protein